jgi:hypothetical protein
LEGSNYDLAIADACSIEKKDDKRKLPNKTLNKGLRLALAASSRPALVVHSDPSREFYNIQGRSLTCAENVDFGPRLPVS